jgi:hypothetical protein
VEQARSYVTPTSNLGIPEIQLPMPLEEEDDDDDDEEVLVRDEDYVNTLNKPHPSHTARVGVGLSALFSVFEALEAEVHGDVSSLELPPHAPDPTEEGEEFIYVSSADMRKISSNKFDNHRYSDEEKLSDIVWHSVLTGLPSKSRVRDVMLRNPNRDVFNPSGLNYVEPPSPLNELYPFPKFTYNSNTSPFDRNPGIPKWKWEAVKVETEERLVKLETVLPANHQLILTILETNAFAALESGSYHEAELLYKKRLLLVQNTANAESLETLRSTVFLGRALILQNKLVQCDSLFQRRERKAAYAKLCNMLPLDHWLFSWFLTTEAQIAGAVGEYVIISFVQALARSLRQKCFA